MAMHRCGIPGSLFYMRFLEWFLFSCQPNSELLREARTMTQSRAIKICDRCGGPEGSMMERDGLQWSILFIDSRTHSLSFLSLILEASAKILVFLIMIVIVSFSESFHTS